MSKYPLVQSKEPSVHEDDRGELVDARDESARNDLQEIVSRPTMPFFGFSYTYTELRAVGGKTHVASRSTRLHDGKLVSESFDAELDGGAYDKAVRSAADQFANAFAAQMSLLLAPFSWLLPRGRGDRR